MTVITVAPAGPKTAAATIRALFEQAAASGTSIQVRAYYRDTARAPQEFSANPSFKAVKGDLEDPSSLDFSGSDVVWTTTPPTPDGRDTVAQAEKVSLNVRNAVEAAGSVKKLVLLGSIGGHLTEGVGEIKSNNAAERVLSQTKVPQITIARCHYFMENWAMAMATLKGPEPFIFSTLTPLDYAITMVAVKDIGKILAREVLTVAGASTSDQGKPNPYIFEIHGAAKYSSLDVQRAVSKAIGQDVAIKPVEKDQLSTFFGQFMSPTAVPDIVEMSLSILPGGKMVEEPDPISRDIVRGDTSLDEGIKDIISHARATA
ncbi:unnamed protein product [Clonostachys rhizophaga]|uniref:NAD(P)-binding domain-containing protein n=1 Tax=Clonostachys rhizophaga TaxID=160324 RepID=A0A9N9VMG4_9HYPO|nr:unnamed protein product [Clonostachys rhizophaga]